MYEIDHYGMVTQSIVSSRKRLERLGYESITETILDDKQDVKVQFMINTVGERLELIEPASAASPVHSRIRRGFRLDHIAFKVPTMKLALRQAVGEGYKVISPPKPGAGHHSRLVAFLYHNDVGIVEFVEWGDSIEI